MLDAPLYNRPDPRCSPSHTLPHISPMNNFPSSPSSVPSIRINGADDSSSLYVPMQSRPVSVSSSRPSFDGQLFPEDMSAFMDGAAFYACSHSIPPDCKELLTWWSRHTHALGRFLHALHPYPAHHA